MLSLEQLDIVFNQNTSAFIDFAFEDARWLFRRYVLRHKRLKNRPRYHTRIQEQEALYPDRHVEGAEMQEIQQDSTVVSDSDSQRAEGVDRRPRSSEAVTVPIGTHR
jgi:hypothetical protein